MATSKVKKEPVDVNQKVEELTNEVFNKYNPMGDQRTEQGNPYVNSD